MNKNGTVVNYLMALLIILTQNFFLPRLMPGDPLQAIYGDEAMLSMTSELKAELVRRFSLDRTLSEQFIAYVWSLIRGDLGYSYFYNAPVLSVIAGFLPWTLLLTGLALLLSTLLGFALGIESGYKRDMALDRFLLTGLIFFSGFPDFFVGILLLLFFGTFLHLAPLSGALTPYAGQKGLRLIIDALHHLVLPLGALVLVRMTDIYLLVRGTVVTILGEAFILTAKAKGCHDAAIRYVHAGRSSLLPVVAATGVQFSHLVTGALFIEIVFNYPGMGTLLYNALLTRDYPLLQGILLLTAFTVLTINFLLELLYKKLDPRLSYER